LQSKFTGFVVADVGDRFVGNAEGVFLSNFFIMYPFFQFEPIPFFEEIVVFSPGLIELLHLALDTLLHLRLLLI
jgi:hypothetical protein